MRQLYRARFQVCAFCTNLEQAFTDWTVFLPHFEHDCRRYPIYQCFAVVRGEVRRLARQMLLYSRTQNNGPREQEFSRTGENSQMRNKQKGFSLIELLIVVAIILIIAAIAIPNLLR